MPNYNYNDLYKPQYIQGGIAKFTFDITQGTWDGVINGNTYFDTSTKTSLSTSNPNQQALFRNAIEAWSNVANLDLTEGIRTDPSDSVVVITKADEQNITGPNPQGPNNGLTFITQLSGNNIIQQEIVLDLGRDLTKPEGFRTAVHEFGHALGLDDVDSTHPGVYNRDVTVMSYTQGAYTNNVNGPVTPMILDIQAVQARYGANFSYHNTNTAYTFTGADKAYTIWDGGGVDALDASAYAGGGVTLDLRAGFEGSNAQYVNKVGNERIFIAYHADIENAIGGAGNDTIYGNDSVAADGQYAAFDGKNMLVGAGGDDFINGLGGNDTLTGSYGYDTLDGGAGSDVFQFATGDGSDVIIDEDGLGGVVIDGATIAGTASYDGNGWWTLGGYSLTTGGGDLFILPATGNDLITVTDFDPAGTKLGISLQAPATVPGDEDGPPGIALYGDPGNQPSRDRLVGTVGRDNLNGKRMDDTLIGGSGRDNLNGGSASDWIYGGAGNDILNGGVNDSGTGGNPTMPGYLPPEADGVDYIYGGSGTDLLFSDYDRDYLYGEAGNDSLFSHVAALLDGGDGTDFVGFLYATAGITANLATHTAINNGFATSLINIENVAGTPYSDLIIGDDNSNHLVGGLSADTLTGSSGADFISGDQGADRFVFTSTLDSGVGAGNRDIVTDFEPFTDKIDLSGLELSFQWLGENGIFTNADNQVRYVHQNGDTIVQIEFNIDKNTVTDFEIQLTGNLTLSVDDFIL